MRLTGTGLDSQTVIVACVWRIDDLLIEIDFVFSESLRQGDKPSKKGGKSRSNDRHHIPYLLMETIHYKLENHSLTKLLDNTHFMPKYLNSATSAVHWNYS
jgi:hypothetical protein